MPVIEVKHPLVKHKVGLLRETTISTKKFRDLTNELGRLYRLLVWGRCFSVAAGAPCARPALSRSGRVFLRFA